MMNPVEVNGFSQLDPPISPQLTIPNKSKKFSISSIITTSSNNCVIKLGQILDILKE
jgi:hypothetical protein